VVPEAINALANLVNAVRQLATAMGSGWFAVTTIGVALVIFGVPAFRENLRSKRADIVVENKEKEVERLAEDNRRYREVYLTRLGVPAGIMKMDREDSRAAARERQMPEIDL